jgi:hypothetical protein
MFRALLCVLAVLCLSHPSLVMAQEKSARSLVEGVQKGCEKELATYCSNVTMGEGRQLACLYAYSDKLSNRCEYALYDASVQLERAINALSYLAQECDSDLEAHCAAVQPGQGRILDCLKKNSAKLSERCNAALADLGAND